MGMKNFNRIASSGIWKIFNIIENNGVSDFKKNGEQNFLKNLLSDCTTDEIIAFDVGGNIGNYSKRIIEEALKFNRKFEIHIFEPTKPCFKILEKNFSDSENIFINNFGLSDQNTKAIIYYNKKKSGLASLYKRDLSEYGTNLTKKENILLKKGIDYVKKENIKHINLLKLDVEGHEMSILKGFGECISPRFVDFIQFEYGGCNIDSRVFLKDYYDFLTDKDFIIAKIMPRHLETRRYSFYMENFIYSNYVAISKEMKNFSTFKNDYILW